MSSEVTIKKTILPFYYLSYDFILSIFKTNKSFMNSYKNNYIEIQKKYEQYYNLNTRKKLNNITSILEESLPTFPIKIKNDINNFTYYLAYSKIMNKILKLNKILLFRYTINDANTYNFDQLISLIMFMDYPKEVILHINNCSLISENQFLILVKEISKKTNITSFTVYMQKNYFTLSRNSKKILTTIKESNNDNEIFFKYRRITYEIYNNENGIENLCYNLEDFNENMVNENRFHNVNINNINNIEISFCFTDEKKLNFEHCLNYLNKALSTQKRTQNNLKLKIQLFTVPSNFDYLNISTLISNIKPNNIILIPYKDVDPKFANDFLDKINKTCELNTLNFVNFVGFSENNLKDFILTQKNLEDLRICGKMGENEMKTILETYYGLLNNNSNNEYKIKIISINGPIQMNENWKNLICNFLTLTQIEAFHVDCFFEERKYMKEIAEAFIDNKTLKSFAVRNTCRAPKDYFVDVLKESLYARNIPRKEVFTKIRLYKLL